MNQLYLSSAFRFNMNESDVDIQIQPDFFLLLKYRHKLFGQAEFEFEVNFGWLSKVSNTKRIVKSDI